MELFLFNTVSNPIKSHDFKMPVAVELSLNTGVPWEGCGWSSSARATLRGNAFWEARKIPPVSASAVELTTFLRALQRT